LSGVQKFSYLKAQLEGDAARTISGLPLTERNYASSIALLEDHRHKIIDAHMRALRDMLSPSNSLNSLRIFHDSVESHIQGLASLGKSETSYGELLVPTILDKLPTDIQKNLACEHSNTQWILSDLMGAILKEIRILECGHHKPLKQSSRSSTAAFPLPFSYKDQFNKKQLNLKILLTVNESHSVCSAKAPTLHIAVLSSQIIRNNLTLSRTVHYATIV